MHVSLRLSIATLVLLVATAAFGESRSPRLDVRLRAEEAKLLLGEPLLLTVVVKNAGDVPLEVEPPLLQEDEEEPRIRVFLAQGDSPFQRYKMGIFEES